MELINKNLIKNSNANSLELVFEEISDLLIKNKLIKNKKELIDGFKKRESQGSTALVDGFAIPHTINNEIEEPKIVILRNTSINNWKTIDDSIVDTIIAIIVPENGANIHLKILAKLSGKLADLKFAKKIKTMKEDFIVKEINDISLNIGESNLINNKFKYDVVAVTSCPTGIAHTYMAAEYLRDKAKELKLNIKVETQGQTIDNILTQEEIDYSKAIIIGVDREIDMSRFSGKKVYKTTTKKIIANPEIILNDALDNKDIELIPASIKKIENSNSIIGEGQLTLNNFGSRSWKAVMNGVSFMLPFVIFGGIMIALAFLIDTIAGNSNAGSSFGHVNPLAGFLKDIGGISMGLMIPVLTGYTMFALIGRPGLLPGFVIGMLAAGSGPVFTDVFGINAPQWLPTLFTDQNQANSGFIGGIIGAFLGTVVVVYVSKCFDYLPSSMRGIKQILLLPLFGTMAATIIFWFVNIPLVYLMWGLLTLLYEIDQIGLTWLLAMLLAGMMAIDMGGPINKTSYVFGTVMLSSSVASSGGFSAGYVYMAAVMAGGMVPPIAIAIATLFGRNEIWDSADKEGGITNWIMGASFITEGAIPFASKYPKSIMLPNIIGSAISGLIVGLFAIGIQAPHGGIFVIALVNSFQCLFGFTLPFWMAIIMYLFAIFLGSFVSALTIVFLRKKEVLKNKKL